MARSQPELGRLNVTTVCDSCGIRQDGIVEGENSQRCAGCGQFANDASEWACAQHELKNSPYPTGECPYCEQERHREAMIHHEMTRDPTLEPW